MTGTDKNAFPNNLLLTNRKVASLSKAFANSWSKDIKSAKTQLSKIMQLGVFLDRLLGPLIKESAIDEKCADIIGKKCIGTIRISSRSLNSRCRNWKKYYCLGPLTLHQHNYLYQTKKIRDIVKIVQVSGKFWCQSNNENETEEQIGVFLVMFLGTLAVSLLLESMLVGKGVIRMSNGVHRSGQCF